MKTQIYKQAYCFVEKKMQKFISTLSPEDHWVCTTCSFRTSELLKEPKIKSEKIYYL
jgi:hypothetical protein